MPGLAASFVAGGEFASDEERVAVEAAELANDRRDWDRGWELANDAVARFPDSLEAHRALCLAAVYSRRLPELLGRYNPQAAADNDAKVKALYVFAWSSILIGDIEAARTASAEALRLAPRPRFELRRIALVARRNGDNPDKEALGREFKQLVDDYPTFAASWASYLNYFNLFDRGSTAHWAAVEEALAKGPGSEIYGAKADLLDQEFWTDYDAILDLLEEGLDKFPESSSLALQKLRVLRQLGLGDEALAWAQLWTAKAPNDANFRFELFTLLMDQNRWDEALAVSDGIPKIKYAESFLETLGFYRAQALHLAGRRAEAIDELTRYIDARPPDQWNRLAIVMRARLLSASDQDRVVVLPSPGYLQQRGNYCGPATMSVILRHAGIDKTQDEIAKRVYTGIAGTPPQVLHNYAASLGLKSFEFEGTPERWKEVLDAGHPILWLQMLGSRGAHYRVVVGYDDVMRSWMVQDPNDYRRTRMSYDEVADFWPFPDMRRSFVMVPESEANDPLLAQLKPTFLLIVTNWILYVSTGSNLFVGLFPAIIVNLAVATILGWLILFLLRIQTFPRHGLRARYFFLAIVGLVAPVNLMIALLRWGSAVSLLLGLHLALLSLIPLLAICAVVRPLLRDFFHPRETIGLCILTALTWISLSFVDRDPWQWIIPVAVFVVGGPIVLAPRVRLRWAERRLRAGQPLRALAVFRRFGSEATIPMFRALREELDALLHLGRLTEARETAGRLVGLRPVPERELRRVRLELRLMDLIEGRPPADPAAPQPTDPIAEALAQLEQNDPTTIRTHSDRLLEALGALTHGTGPLRGSALADLTFLLYLTAAIQAAETPTRATQLKDRWMGLWALRARLLMGIG